MMRETVLLTFRDLVFYVDFMLNLVTILVPFGALWLPLGSLWLPFGSLLVPFGSLLMPFGSLLVPFGTLLLTPGLYFLTLRSHSVIFYIFIVFVVLLIEIQVFMHPNLQGHCKLTYAPLPLRSTQFS